MKVLVTGHRGFIGTVMVPMLLKEGFDVTGLDTDLYRYCTYGEEPLAIPEINKDVRDVEASDLEGFDAIVHLAALSNDPLGNINPELTYDINYRASVRIAELAKQVGVKRFKRRNSTQLHLMQNLKSTLNVMFRKWQAMISARYLCAMQPLMVYHQEFALTLLLTI